MTLEGDLPGFVYSYRRQGLSGPVRVEIITVFRTSGYLLLTLSYRESEADRWAPLVTAMRQSLAFSQGN